MHKEITLKNGLKVLLVPIPGVQSLTIMKMYNVGSRQETPDIFGVAHFLEHMMFKGTQKRPIARDISHELEAVGAQYNAFTGKDMTAYYVKVAAPKFELAVEVLADMLYNSKFDSEELAKEKGVVIEEMKVYEDQPSHYVEDIYEEMIFSGNNLSEKILGTRETINAMTREQLVDYRDRFYHDHNSILCVSGAVPENAEDVLNQYWNHPQTNKELNGNIYQPFVNTQTEPRVTVFAKKVEQAHLQIGFMCDGFSSEESYAYHVLCSVMGAGMSSRLFEELREKRGLCYYVRMSPDLFTDAGSLVVKSGLNQDKLEEAITIILSELKKLKEELVESKELEKAKDFIIGNTILSLEDSAHVAESYMRTYVVTGKLLTPQEKMAKVAAVTAEDVMNVAKKILVNERMNLAVITTEPDKDKLLSLLKI